MPQMFPSMWLFLMIMIILVCGLFMIVNYFSWQLQGN